MTILYCATHACHYDDANGCSRCPSDVERLSAERDAWKSASEAAVGAVNNLGARVHDLENERNDWKGAVDLLGSRVLELVEERNALLKQRDTPEIEDFIRGVQLEAVHQRGRWDSDHDAGKTPADWFWLVGYLAGKALHAVIGGNTDKAKHHLITTAAALCNWHAALIEPPKVDS